MKDRRMLQAWRAECTETPKIRQYCRMGMCNKLDRVEKWWLGKR